MDYKPKQKELLYDPGVDANGNRRDITRDVSNALFLCDAIVLFLS